MNNFKPKKLEKDVISIRITTDLLNKIDSIACKNDISRNELIVQCIEYAISNMDK
ncbi:MAG: ribbon-helix-helix protein, CopG family [Eubacterium sp.]